MKKRPRHLITWFAVLSTAVCAGGQITTEPIIVETEGGTARGWVATVDLADPAVEVVTLVEPGERAGTASLISPEAWLDDPDLELVVNANFFGAKPDGTATIVGLCVTDGTLLSRPRSFDGRIDPALGITDGGIARIGLIGEDALSGLRCAVAGVGGSSTSSVAGTLLIDGGQNRGDSARVQPKARHPRTAIGVSRDGRQLLIVVVDGRQEGWSVGVTLPELSELLVERGAWDAVNLDGGGSSAIVWRDGDELVSNRPSDGGYRPVAVSLGVRMEERLSASQADGE